MINIYTNSKLAKIDAIKQSTRVIDIPDWEFRENIGPKDLIPSDIDIMKRVDKITHIDEYSIGTVHGNTDIYHLSTGCKTVIIVNHMVRNIGGFSGQQIINIRECGENAIEEIFDIVDNTAVCVVLTHSYITTIPDKKYVFNVIGHGIVHSISDLSTIIDGQVY